MLADGAVKPVGDENRLVRSYAHFHEAATDWRAESASARAARAPALSATLRQRLWLIALNLTADDQAQVIFETLNVRGTPLLPAAAPG